MQELDRNDWAKFDAICRAMADPGWYDAPVNGVEQRQTHISTVFLTGQWAYKLKKPVNFGFLDFRNLGDRRHFCEQEIRLNQRLSHDIYEDVVGIYEQADGQFSFKGTGPVVEYAVKMRQLPDSASLRQQLRQGSIAEAQMEALGRKLAEFYKTSDRRPEIDHYGSPDVISQNMEENPELFGLIDFYACYRATVKLKTTGFRYLEVQEGEKEAHKRDAKRYLELAYRYEVLKQGRSVILDATFSSRKWRDVARLVAADMDANLIVVECVVSEQTIRERLQMREKTVGLSDARLEHLLQIREDFDPVVELPPEIHFKADCDQPFQKTLVSLLAEAYICKREQVIGLLRR